jgi:hypothetical protein
MVLMVGIVVVALWLGVGAGGALLLALLACTAMMVAMVWIVMRATRTGAAERFPRQETLPHDGGAFPGRRPRV